MPPHASAARAPACWLTDRRCCSPAGRLHGGGGADCAGPAVCGECRRLACCAVPWRQGAAHVRCACGRGRAPQAWGMCLCWSGRCGGALPGLHTTAANSSLQRGLWPAEDHKPAQPDERARIMAAGGFLSEIGGITRVNGEGAWRLHFLAVEDLRRPPAPGWGCASGKTSRAHGCMFAMALAIAAAGNLNLSRAIGDLRYKMNSEVGGSDALQMLNQACLRGPRLPCCPERRTAPARTAACLRRCCLPPSAAGAQGSDHHSRAGRAVAAAHQGRLVPGAGLRRHLGCDGQVSALRLSWHWLRARACEYRHVAACCGTLAGRACSGMMLMR